MQHYCMYNTKECSWDVCLHQNQEWTTHKTLPSFIWRGKKNSFPASRLLLTRKPLLDSSMYCINPPLELIWNPAGRYEWHPVFLAGWRSNFCNSDKGQAYAWGKSSLAVGRITLHHAAKWKMKAGFPVLPAKHWMMGCCANPLTLYGFIRLIYSSMLSLLNKVHILSW